MKIKKFQYIVFILSSLSLITGLVFLTPSVFAQDDSSIPTWIKTTTKFWISGEVNDQEFISALQFLANKDILVVPPVETISDHSTETLITNQQPIMQNLNSPTLIVSDILQECDRDSICVTYRLNSLSTNESQYVVMSVLNGIVSTWEDEPATCHDIAHHLAHFLFEYFDRDVSEALSHVDSTCGNALYHGIIEYSLIDQMNSKNIDRDDVDITSTCKNVGSSPTTNLHTQCAHGIGHAIAQLYEHDVFEGIKRCDDLELLSEQDMCYDGFFMDNDRENFFTKGGDFDKDDIYYPCNKLDEKYKERCYFFQGYYILRENGKSYEPSLEQCSNLPDEKYIGKCIGAVSQEMTYNHFYSNLGETLKMCNKVMPKYQMDCILPSVDALTLYIDESLGYELCQYLRADQKDICIKRWDGVRTYVDTK